MLATTGIPIFFLLFAEYNEHVLKRVVRMTTTSIHHLVCHIAMLSRPSDDAGLGGCGYWGIISIGNYIPLYSKSSLNLFQGTFIFYSELLNLLIIFIIFTSLKQIRYG